MLNIEFKDYYSIYILGQDKGYSVKYRPLAEGVFEVDPEGTLEGKEQYLTVYPEKIPNTNSLSFLWIFRKNFCIVIPDRVVLEELIISIPLPERTISHHTLPRGQLVYLPG